MHIAFKNCIQICTYVPMYAFDLRIQQASAYLVCAKETIKNYCLM